MPISSKISWANNLRAAATLGVIFIHSSSYLTGSFGQIPQSHWLAAIVINTAVRWAVPIFIMLTGSFVLANYNDQPRAFFKKAFYKILVPFFIWSVVYLGFNYGADLMGHALSWDQKKALVIEKAFTGTAVHLWYIYMILCMYLLIPIISKWTSTASQKELSIFIAFWFFLLFAYPWVDQFKHDLELGLFTGYIGYLIAGYYFFKYLSIPKWISWTLLFGSLAFIATATYLLAFKNNVDKEMFLAPLTPGVFIMSSSVYLIFKQSNFILPTWLELMVDQVCKYSYGIYLVHLIVLSLIDDYILSASTLHPILGIPLISILCLAFSLLVIYLLRKIPLIGKWVG
jgi:surface polysaccharide O-acyltransferase-like enzyme